MGRFAYLDTYAPAPEGVRVAYTDGSSSGGTLGPAGWAWYCTDHDWGSGGVLEGTNNHTEIEGIIQAMLATPTHEPLVIVSDSQYAINAIFKWAEGWARRGWRTATGESVKNVALIMRAQDALVMREAMTFVKHVRGHGKDPQVSEVDLHGNAMADLLAVDARKRVAGAGEADEFCPFDLRIVHGRGRKKRSFVESWLETPVAELGVC